MQFTPDEIMSLFRTLAAILHLGNVKFLPTTDNSDGCLLDSSTQESFDHVCRLVGFDREQLDSTLRSRYLKVGPEVTLRPLKANEVSTLTSLTPQRSGFLGFMTL